jgi:DNA polymerase-3 subunit delta'
LLFALDAAMTWTVAGQDAAINVLKGAASDGRLSHAYLFTGPAHTGKTLAALQFAQLLNCTGPEPPCGRCRQCEHIASGAHPDVEIVAPGGLCDDPDHSHTPAESRGIRICQIRRLERVISRSPYEGRYRVLIIEPAELLNREAEVALLKTLEEPPANVVIILIAEHEEHLLETVRSRARRVAFRGMAKDEIERALRTRWDVEATRAAELARLSGGRIGWAVLALHDERMVEHREEALQSAETLAPGTVAERFTYAGTLGGRYSKDRAGVQATLEMWQEFWRDLLLITAGRADRAGHRDRLDRLQVLASACDGAGAARALRAITDARQQLDENASPVLALEVMMLALPQLRPNAVANRLRS